MFGSGRRYIDSIAISIVLATICAAASITCTYGVFDVTFYNTGDTDGYITGQQDWTPQQMADVQASISEWQFKISNTPGRQVQMHLFWNELDTYGTNVLGGSQSYGIADGTTHWNAGEYVWKQGLDPGISSYGFDTVIQYDTTCAGRSWNFGDNSPVSGQIDFRSVITHEIGHSLGFDSTYDKDYDDFGWMYTDPPYGSYYGLTDWDKHLVDSLGNKPVNGGTGAPENFNQLDNPVFFDGENAVALYGGLVPVYAPSTFQSGSSLVHLDEALLGSLLMSPAIASGQMVRNVSELEWAIMKDIGWNIVPEPVSAILLLSGIVFCRFKRH